MQTVSPSSEGQHYTQLVGGALVHNSTLQLVASQFPSHRAMNQAQF